VTDGNYYVKWVVDFVLFYIRIYLFNFAAERCICVGVNGSIG